jgi:hypothetical protein
MDIETEEELEMEEDALKISIAHRWSHKEFDVIDRLSMRSIKTRLKTIVIEKRSVIKKPKTDTLIKGIFSSLMIIES